MCTVLKSNPHQHVGTHATTQIVRELESTERILEESAFLKNIEKTKKAMEGAFLFNYVIKLTSGKSLNCVDYTPGVFYKEKSIFSGIAVQIFKNESKSLETPSILKEHEIISITIMCSHCSSFT